MMRSSRIIAVLVFAMCGPAAAQMPRVGIIDFYGLRTLKPADLAGALGVQIGDTLRGAPNDFRDRLLRVPGVLDADVSVICCEDARSIMYVGVREAGAPMLEFNPQPSGSEMLPAELLTASSRFMRALIEGVQRGEAGEDYSAGHSVALYGPARAEQQVMLAFADKNVELLRAVLRNSSKDEHRALAAQILAYTGDKRAIVGDLVAAARDPNEEVRNNALRALAVMAMYEQSHPEADLRVPYAPFIDLLSSLEWTDRNKASFALGALTTSRDPQLLQQLRDRAMAPLIDIARWQAEGHALAAAVVLGRIAGMQDAEIFERFRKDKEAFINTVGLSR